MWPPTIPHLDPLPAAVSSRVQRAGDISLWAGGIGLTAFVFTTAIVLSVIDFLHGEMQVAEYGMSIGCIAGMICEVVALVAGIIGRRTKAGKLGLASLGASLVFFALLTVANYLVTKTWPWNGYYDS